MKKRVLGLLCILALCFGLMPASAFASQEIYVALGDSITAGYGLAEDEPSFPEIIAEDRGAQLCDFGQPEGWTSAKLLKQLQTPEVAAAVASADIVTITIGGNDLMDALYAYLAGQTGGKMTADDIREMLESGKFGPGQLPLLYQLIQSLNGFAESEQATNASTGLSANLTAIISGIKQANPDVTLVMANQYNPYGHLDNLAAQQIVEAFDAGVATLNTALGQGSALLGYTVADAYSAFAASEENPCNASFAGIRDFNLDFHPNAYGHELIAQTIEGKLPEVPVSVTGVTLDKVELSLTAGDSATLIATVEPADADDSSVVWKSSDETVVTVADGKVTAVAPGAATITVTTTDGGYTASCTVTVAAKPSVAPPEPSGPSWDTAINEIAGAESGETVTVDMDGESVLPAEVLEALAGRDVTLVLDMGDGIFWEIDGSDVSKDAGLADVDLGIEMGTDDIPVHVARLVTSKIGAIQFTLGHEGPFGFALTLVLPLGSENEGLFANLYCYDADTESLGYEASGIVDEDGVARIQLDHASSWLVAVDDRLHSLPFTDADEDLWYSEPVRWAWLNGVMTGYGVSGEFGPNDQLTRAQMAAVLYNVAGKPEVPVAGLPADCDGEAWYAACVSWALATGVFNGYGDGSAFGPDDPLTREQAACVLMNAASLLGADTSARADLSAYPDADGVSSWAFDALSWAVANEVVNGVETEGGRELQPTRSCTRAEMAALMMNLSARAEK